MPRRKSCLRKYRPFCGRAGILFEGFMSAMLTNNNDTAKKIKIFDENYSKSMIFDRLKQIRAFHPITA